MEIYVLSEKLDRIGVVDIYEALIWNTSYNDIGSFQINCPLSFTRLLQPEKIIQNSEDDKHNGIVEYIEKVQDDEGVEKLIVKGRMIEAYLERRIVKGTYVFESMEPARIISSLITQNAITSADAERRIEFLEVGTTATADEGTICYGGINEALIDVVKNICKGAQLGFRLYADDKNKKLIVDIYKGANRTEEENTVSKIEVKEAVNVLSNSHFEDRLTGWHLIDGGTNYQGQAILSADNGIFRKTKIKDRYAEYWETTGKFKQWVYFYRKAGYIYQDISLTKEHIYYIDIRCSNPTDSVLGYGIIDSEGGCTFNVSKTSESERFSAMYVPENTKAYKFSMAYGELPEIDGLSVYVDYGVMIDLTATFGAGREPELDWCKNNIYYDSGWKYKIEIIEFVPNHIDPLILSRDRDTLVEVEYIKNITNECTVMYVQGDGIDTIVTTGGGAGIMRKERAIDLSGEIPRERDGVIIPEPSYTAMLQTSVKATMRKLVVNEIIDGKLYPLSSKRFGKNFFLGDIVTCTDDSIGISANLRITAATETWDINGYSVTVTLGDDIPSIHETMKLISKGAKK